MQNQTDRQRQTDRDRQTETDRQTDRQTDRHENPFVTYKTPAKLTNKIQLNRHTRCELFIYPPSTLKPTDRVHHEAHQVQQLMMLQRSSFSSAPTSASQHSFPVQLFAPTDQKISQ